MRTRILMIIIAATVVIAAVILLSTSANHELQYKQISCSGDFIQHGNGCILDPRSIGPNTIIIHHVTENTAGTRLAISPQTLVIDMEENNTITWVNQGIFTAKITDRERGLWALTR